MKIKVDENLPSRLIVGLRGLGHDVEAVAAALAGCYAVLTDNKLRIKRR